MQDITFQVIRMLEEAVQNGETHKVDYLLNTYNNINVEAKKRNGSTLLHTAVKNGHLGIVNLLLENNVSMLNMKDRNGNQAIHLAVIG